MPTDLITNGFFSCFFVFFCFYPVLLRHPFFIGFNPTGGFLTEGGAYGRRRQQRALEPRQQLVWQSPQPPQRPWAQDGTTMSSAWHTVSRARLCDALVTLRYLATCVMMSLRAK